MGIRNYTSSVPFERSVAEIERKLVASGARNIAKKYEDRRLVALVFELWDGKHAHAIRLPANSERIFEVLFAERKRAASRDKERIWQQAERTAWKLMLDWIDLQLTLIRLNQAEPLEIFMPYIFNGHHTLFEIARENNFNMLPAPGVSNG